MRKDGKPCRQFKGNCNYCGKQGHKAADCFEKKSFPGINYKKDNRKCFNCNMRGHIARDSPRKEERAESLFVGTVATEGKYLPNAAKDNNFYSWWIDDDAIFNEMLFPEEGLRIAKGFDETTKVGNTTFRLGMTKLCDKKAIITLSKTKVQKRTT
jgi:hypothetical protein